MGAVVAFPDRRKPVSPCELVWAAWEKNLAARTYETDRTLESRERLSRRSGTWPRPATAATRRSSRRT
ncbi:hypothetical protein [Azospirillum sp. SYSU D00513]|uniref:hypothetical protein n=1 Tax=Azospirillum sp. SYSU D00513 TaxID=2812561 RepID=UPI001A96CFEC|nr:hypothetical protein [Azospirillum sp. SYSU D00513]